MADAPPAVLRAWPPADEVTGLLDELDAELIGLLPVKDKIRELASLLLIDRLRRTHGLEAEAPTLHMCFLGRPGTGKTLVAKRIGYLLYRLGYLRGATTRVVTRDDLVGGQPGESGRRTRAAVEQAMGGVLFVDEAYTVCRGPSDAAGLEAVETLMQEMELHRSDLAVVLAGYHDRMSAFFEANDGLRSRVAHVVDFPDLEVDELVAVARTTAHQSGYRLDPGAVEVLASRVAAARQEPHFANARTVRNIFEAARLRHATRLLGSGERAPSLSELTVLTEDDFRVGTPGRCARAEGAYLDVAAS